MFLKKSIILTSNSSKDCMAILKMDNTNSSYTYCTIKAYNLKNNEYILGIENENSILKQNIFLDKNGVYNFKLSKLNADSINLVLADDNNGILSETLSSCNSSHKANILRAITPKRTIDKQNIDSTKKELETLAPQVNDSDNIEKLFEEDTDIENLIDENIAHTVTNLSTKNTTIDAILNNATPINLEENISEPTFYEQIKSQIDELFATNDRETNLEKIVPNSEWVTIAYDGNNQKHYVVGLIYEEGIVKYICFGVPGSMEKPPEDDLKDYSQWLPTDIVNPKDNGYWVMYQDAVTGKNIAME